MAAVGVASTSCRCSSVVFVGNIPYHASEKELLDACEEIGPVVSLRVSMDKDTGRPKGFAFCEYLDDETARSACRNLHGHPLRGRALRVGVSRHQQHQQRGVGDPDAAVGVEDATHAASLVEGLAPSEAVTRYLAGTSRRQLRGLLEVVAREDAGVVERAKSELSGLATLIEQARILVEDVGVVKASDGGGVAGKRAGGLEEAEWGAPAAKVRKVGDGAAVPGVVVACR